MFLCTSMTPARRLLPSSPSAVREAFSGAPDQGSRRVRLEAEASGRLVGPPVFKTGVPARAGRRVRFPSASATSDLRFWLLGPNQIDRHFPGLEAGGIHGPLDSLCLAYQRIRPSIRRVAWRKRIPRKPLANMRSPGAFRRDPPVP